jgi:uncharacterized protein (DUF3084 family)
LTTPPLLPFLLQLEQAGADHQQLEQQLGAAQQALSQAQAAREAAQSEQRAAAAEARRAQQEAAAAQEQFKCIFRQVGAGCDHTKVV